MFCRVWRETHAGQGVTLLAAMSASEHPSHAILHRLVHECGLKDELDSEWAVRPLEMVHDRGRTVLMLDDPGGQPLAALLGSPLELGRFLPLAVGTATALGKIHQRGLIHKDIKPANIMVGTADGNVRVTGFGIASRLSRERQAPEPPEMIAGTLAYMAPEQTGWTNRSIDARSDLYSFGVILYQMLTGCMPFTASEPMEWVHCHLARKPVPPSQRLDNVLAPVSAIIMKLLAKTPEERYQTAGGVERDLRRCLAEWQARRRIDDFPLGLQDTPDRLLIPEKLYGREREIAALHAIFERIIKSGAPELVLVSGYSGIGKSSVVNELHKALVPSRSLFASGKFDQYKRDIPYGTLVQAFQGLVRHLLSKCDAELASWRHALLEALGANGRLMVDLIPELKPIIGDQPVVPELPAQQAQSRFHMTFQRFISVFARPEHPLALFLDDLQWLDAATLDLLENLLTWSDVQHLMVIGAYRDNEVTAAHPLMQKLDAIKICGGKVAELTLAPLGREHLRQLIADTLRCESDRVAPLAELVHEKTGGNPYFAIQFLSSLAEESLLTFDHVGACWSWDIGRIQAKGYTDNVIDLMVEKLSRLPAEAQTALQQLACLGNVVEIATLSVVLGMDEEQVDSALWPARRLELVERMARHYRFAHDRVQEAAYSLIPKELRPEAHLRIGRLLGAHTSSEERDEAVFELLNQLNRGATLITSPGERERLAELNLLAGKRSKESTAFPSALAYLVAGTALLSEDAWERQHELTFALELHRAECEFLTGLLIEAEERLKALYCQALTSVEHAAIACLGVDLYTTLGQTGRAVAVGLDYLRHLGVEWSPHPADEDVRREYERMWSLLGSRAIEELIDLPLMTDANSLATVDVLIKATPAALFSDWNLHCLFLCRTVNLSLEHGNSDASCLAYTFIATVLGPRFGKYDAAYRFGCSGLQLVEKHGLDRFKARVYLVFGNLVNPWARHVRMGPPFLRRSFEIAQQTGDLNCAVYCRQHLITNLLACGNTLDEVQREAEAGLELAHRARFSQIVEFITPQLGLIRTLRGLTPVFGYIDHVGFDEQGFEKGLEADPSLAITACCFWLHKLEARFFAGDHAASVAAATNAERFLRSLPFFLERAEYHFYAALARAARYDAVGAGERVQYLDALVAHSRQLQEWAENCPENFEDRSALVSAEIARIEGRELDATNLYEQAIRSAQANGFVHHEALASELASRFYAARGFEIAAHGYLRNARHCYLRWGAHGKVRQLDELFPHLRREEPVPASTSTMATPVEQLDLATVIKVSQAISSAIVLEKLLETLMGTAIEQAGAERGLLILSRGDELRIAAEATTSDNLVVVRQRDESVAAGVLPDSVLHYVLRTGESVILDDGAGQSPFAADPYFRSRHARSVLCMPLLNQAKVIGVLYLENNLAPSMFAPGRIAVLKVLASQAAISLENTHLYEELANREARIRRLVDSNVIGIVIWDLDGRLLDANEAFLSMVQYGREDLDAGLRWFDMTPAEWQEVHAQNELLELQSTGIMQPREKEFFRKDRSRVPVLIGAAAFEGQPNQGVAYILDLTNLKRAEAEARESERRYQEVQMQLVHGNRVATLGELTASIAHEVNQPIAAIILNAQVALRLLQRVPSNLREVRKALEDIAKDGKRSGEVIDRMRALIKKAPPSRQVLDVNEALGEIIDLIHGEVVKNRIAVRTQLCWDLPTVQGDRVQLQQVFLNLMVNAIEAMSEVNDGNRNLQISTETDANGILVSMGDSGPGVPASTFERVFDAFYTTKETGLGVGLSICRSIIEAHGGRLWASANVPRGTMFRFTLPLDDGQCDCDPFKAGTA